MKLSRLFTWNKCDIEIGVDNAGTIKYALAANHEIQAMMPCDVPERYRDDVSGYLKYLGIDSDDVVKIVKGK